MKLLNMKTITIAAMVMSLFACKIHPPTTVDYDTQYDYSQLKSFAWAVAKKTNDTRKIKTLNDRRQSMAIEKNLMNKGLIRAASVEVADVILRTHTINDKKTDVNVFYNMWGYYPYHFYQPYGWPRRGATTVAREYEIGTLVLDVIDPRKKEVIWRGSLSRKLGVYLNRTPEERDLIAQSNAAFLLESFPPNAQKIQ